MLSDAEQRRTPSYIRDLIEHHLEPMFNRMIAQAAIFMDSCKHIIQMSKYRFNLSRPDRAEHFRSLAEAREALDSFMRRMFYALEGAEDAPNVRIDLEEHLEAWLHTFDAFLAETLPELESESLRAARFLKVYYHVSVIVIDAYLSPDEVIFDGHIDRFKEIVNLAAQTLQSTGATGHQAKLNFSFDLGICPALYLASSRCRDPIIRRTAIALLRFSHRESSWYADHTARSAQRIMEIEESDIGLVESCKDVPEKNRIRKVYADVLHEKGHIMILYVHAPYELTTPLDTAYISLESGSAQRLPLRGSATGNRSARKEMKAGDKPYNVSLVPSFIPKTYFPQDAI